MTDIFVSYASEDREYAARLVAALESSGLDVWWDRELTPGSQFRDKIDQMLQTAKCIVVLWSQHSIRSDWVIGEALTGLDRGILVPATIDGSRVPVPFNAIQTARLALDAPLGLTNFVDAVLEKIAAGENGQPTARSARESLTNSDMSAGISKPQAPFRKWARVALSSAAAVALVALLGWLFFDFAPTNDEVFVTPVKAQPTIVVLPLTKRIGSPEVDWLGEGIASLIRDALANSKQAIVYSGAVGVSIANHGADYVIDGDYMQTPSQVVVTTRIEDVAKGQIIPGDTIEAGSVEEAILMTKRTIARIKQSLNLPYREQVGQFAADFAASNLQSYELYIKGLEFFENFDYDNAKSLLTAAIEVSPNFSIARYRLAQILEATGENKKALAMLEQIQVAGLSDRERLYIEGARVKFTAARDAPAAISTFTELVEKYPFDSEGRQNLAEAYWLDYQDQAAVDELQILVEMHPREAASWMALGERQIALGDLTGAGTSLERYLALRPNDPYPRALLGDLAMREGGLKNARSEYVQALAIKPNHGSANLGLVRLDYLQGDSQGAFASWTRLISHQDLQPDERIDAAFDFAGGLLGTGRYAEVDAVFATVAEDLKAEGFREALVLVTRAIAQHELGNDDDARTLLNAAIEQTPTGGHPTRAMFFKALFALERDGADERRATMEQMQTLELTPGSVQAAVRDAALDYLSGLAKLDSDPPQATVILAQAVANEAPHYVIYEHGLARALAANGRVTEALGLLAAAVQEQHAGLRFDLELFRTKAESYAERLSKQKP